jgi:hypothetical protein
VALASSINGIFEVNYKTKYSIKMKILLVGEYSRLHNSLKEGLLVLGHEVTLISTGDYFKDFPSDIKIIQKYDRGIWQKLKVGIYKIFRKDLT